MQSQYQYIISNPKILDGRPVIKGTRISVRLILEWMAHGSTIDQIIKEFPQLTPEAIKEALLFAGAASDKELDIELSLG